MVSSERHTKILGFEVAKTRTRGHVTFRRRLAIAAWVMAGLLGSRPAWADDQSKKTCASAFTSAQRLMRSGQLLEARKMLVVCGGPQCPTVMHPDCNRWLAAVETSTPTVVFQVSAAKGAPPPDVQVVVDDGESMPFDGRALSMDPGTHEVSFVAEGFAPEHRRVVVSEGEKLHRETVELVRVPDRPAPKQDVLPPAAERSAHRSRITAPVVLASTAGVAAGVAAVILGVKARGDDRGLGQCSPNCTRERADQVRSEYLWTNVSIGVAVAGVATAAGLFLLRGDGAPPTSSVAFGVDVTAKALAPTVTGRF
jgi:hypothetical protein